jgi:GTP cyclohydrolase I
MDAVTSRKLRDHVEMPSRDEAEEAVRLLLRYIGDDPNREGLLETPHRVVKSFEELFGGYNETPGDVLGRTFEDVSGFDDLVLVRNIPFFSHCEQHMLPILGKAHVAYLPDGCVLGLSKIARVIDIFARRLQTQEALTAQVARSIEDHLRPRGVAVLIEAEHMCQSMRGVGKQGATAVTTTFAGEFASSQPMRDRFLAMLPRAGNHVG